MRRRIVRAIFAAGVTVAVSGGGAARAHTTVTVPGCFGAGPAVVCELTLDVGPLESVTVSFVDVPVCVSTCTWVGVPLPDVALDLGHPICARWTDLAGDPSGQCWSVG